MCVSLRPLLAVLLLTAGSCSRQLRQLQPGSHGRQPLAAPPAASSALCGLLCALRSDCTAVEFTPSAGCLLLGCDPGWSGHLGFCYRAVLDPLTWTKADGACRDSNPGARLASVLSADERQFLLQLMEGHNTTRYHIGLVHRPKFADGEWRWLDESELSFTSWGTDQPDGNWTDKLRVYMNSFGNWHDTDMYETASICKYKA